MKLKALAGMLRMAVVRPSVIVDSFMMEKRRVAKIREGSWETDVVQFTISLFAGCAAEQLEIL